MISKPAARAIVFLGALMFLATRGAAYAAGSADAQAPFAALDRDGDGRLKLAELFTDGAPPPGDSAAVKRHGQLRRYHETWLAEADRNRDSLLDPAEFAARLGAWQPVAFARFIDRDTDGDGKVTRAEYYAPHVGGKWEQAARDESTGYDLNEDGFFSWTEFRMSPGAEATGPQRFAALDGDGDGRLTLAEQLAPYAPSRRASARRDFFRLDADDDGQVIEQEFTSQAQAGGWPVQREFAFRDEDGDARLSLAEFLAVVAEADRRGATRDFGLADGDGDQRLTREEYAAIPGACRAEDRLPGKDPVLDALEAESEPLRDVFDRAAGGSDRRIAVRDWPAAKLKRVSADLAALPAASWDGDGDGSIRWDECRAMLEQAYGLRRPDGARLQTPAGLVMNYVYIGEVDHDRNGALSKTEFVRSFWMGRERNAQIFMEVDKNRDGRATVAEFAETPHLYNDKIRLFTGFDANLDGRIDQAELTSKAGEWQRSLAARVLRAFDEDGDAKLSLYEFRATPLANLSLNYFAPRQDKDADGELSWAEFYTDASPFGVELAREYFRHFDRDGSGELSYDEFQFAIDPDKAPPEAAFRARDKNGDGKLELTEMFAEAKPSPDDARATERYELRLVEAENRFTSDDANGDGLLDLGEFEGAQNAARQAAERRTAAFARRQAAYGGSRSRLRTAGFVLNALALAGFLAYALGARKA